MWKSGARGSLGQIAQMAGMKGLIVNTRGQTNETPVISSFKEGLTPIEYFNTTHGSRKVLLTQLFKLRLDILHDDSSLLLRMQL